MSRLHIIGSYILILSILCVKSEKGSFCVIPPNFPPQIPLGVSNYRNWAQEIELKNVWTVTPKSPADIVILSNWAVKNGWKVRPRGCMHNWSPLVVTGKESPCSRMILVDTTSLKRMKMMKAKKGEAATVRVETGALLENLLEFLEKNGKGIVGHPATGEITIGGALAVGSHGSGVPLQGHDFNYGTMSNLVKSFKAVIWDKDLESFKIQAFERTDPDANVFIHSLGRMFLVEVTLVVSPLKTFRCISRTDIPIETLFADPNKKGSEGNLTMSSLIESYGAVEAIWFAFTSNPWVKIWSLAPYWPLYSLRTSHPYNYEFSDQFQDRFINTVKNVTQRYPIIATVFGKFQSGYSTTRLLTTLTSDLWGTGKNVFLYVRPTTFRNHELGYVILTKRANIQSILHRVTTFYQGLMRSFSNTGSYPINGPMEIRVSGIDAEIVPNSSPPVLSSLKPVKGHPEYDTAVWFNTLTYPNTPYAPEFHRQLEAFFLTSFTGEAFVRPEWSKGFAYTTSTDAFSSGAWSSKAFLANSIPEAFEYSDWVFARNVFTKYDPHRVFTNEFLEKVFP